MFSRGEGNRLLEERGDLWAIIRRERGKLDRAVEFLPSAAELRKLGHDGKGLTRPELAVLLAYAKLDLDAEILESDLPAFPPGKT